MRQANYRVYLYRKTRHPTSGAEERHPTPVAVGLPDLDSASRALAAYFEQNGGPDEVMAKFDGVSIEWMDAPG